VALPEKGQLPENGQGSGPVVPPKVSVWLPPLVAFALTILIWQIVATHNRFVLSKPGAVFDELTSSPGFYATNTWITLRIALVGLLIGFSLAVLLAVAMTQAKVLERALMPMVVILNVTPLVAIAPGLTVAFGFGDSPKLIVTAIITFFPALINAVSGLRSAEPDALEIFESLNASRLEVLVKLLLPSSLPFLFAAARVCLPLSVVGAVVAEFVSPGVANQNSGLGSAIVNAQADNHLVIVFAAIVCLATVSVVLTLGIAVAERQVLSWHHSQRRGRS
jgi:NitT/TauT family transport system permease protein